MFWYSLLGLVAPIVPQHPAVFHCYRIQEQYLKGNNFEGSSTKYRCACFLEQIKFYLNDGVVQTKTNDGRTTGNVRRNENDIFFSKRKRKKNYLKSFEWIWINGCFFLRNEQIIRKCFKKTIDLLTNIFLEQTF